jgi:hypothetical protein
MEVRMSRVIAALCLLSVVAAASPASRPAATRHESAFAVPTPANPQEIHPRIRAAIGALTAAAAELKAAPHDFNGHRADALKAIDKALAQLNICVTINK